jgi:hypothetical protein
MMAATKDGFAVPRKHIVRLMNVERETLASGAGWRQVACSQRLLRDAQANIDNEVTVEGSERTRQDSNLRPSD